MQKQYYVYIATNRNNTVLYTGMTNSIERRMHEHCNHLVQGFSSKYNITKLVYYEIFNSPDEAICAEKKIKGWVRIKKIDLIEKFNPEFKDLITTNN